ncbi:GNAT family N-acetyltransferase [Clostridium sp. 1001271B_151109_B4]|uniref:GNAT family N-acetyltransferase n=1 Tax=Clostridium sp. 1001271B_151109_B4 TaxID=2787148 RepID=UPI0018ABB8E1|nr:GNAT family N-acetyltransferase [Clostridium sp. 1001271B_151109_B4]
MELEILKRVKEQLAKDYNCSIEDFDNRKNLVTDIKLNEGTRKYTDDKEILKILIFNGKAVLSADECIKEWCVEKFSNRNGDWMFLYSVLRAIDKKLNEFGYEIENTHHYYLPYGIDDDISNDLKWYNKEEIKQFKDDNRFDEAFAFDNNFPDVLAVAKLDDYGNILGIAGASKDSDIMWQIGVNVLEGAEGQGIAKNVVKALKNEILRRGKVPFYGTVESHIISQKVALASGFYPAFAEVKIRKI